MPQVPLTDTDTLGKRLFGSLVAVVAGGFLFSTLFLFNVAQLFSLLLAPFSGPAFRAYNRWTADTWWGWCVYLGKRIYGIRIEVTGDAIPQKENAVVVSNHQEMPDITFLMFLAKSKERLGDLKWFAKDSFKYVPGMGWGMRLIGCVFLKRDWARDRASVERAFSNLIATRMPFWLIIFAEGTRGKAAKIAQSREASAGRGEKPFDHVLPPRTRGFVASVQALRAGHLNAVYDVTIAYRDGVPTLFQYMRGCARVAHFHVRRYPRELLPQTDDALESWLVERFREKDRLLGKFYAEGAF